MVLRDVISNKQTIFADRRRLTILGLLAAILGLGVFLRFYGLGSGGVGNTYYAAAVKSMLLSWKNFFFVAFEPGGSVSLDKPPLGFWAQAVSAWFLGINGFALALPNALAGAGSILIIYKLLKEPFGPWAALLGALALAVMPVAVATERNNTIDGLLVFVLLLAAWAFLKAARTGQLRWLFLGAFIVGLGFNIKMLQAFLPLPAFYALYFFGAKHPFWKKSLHLGAATGLLLVISFSWAAVVDLTPAAQRPYVDSTGGNSAFELIFGHNGIERLTGNRGAPDGGGGIMPQPPSGAALPQQTGRFGPPDGGQPGPMGGGPGGGPGGSMDFGVAGAQRLFTAPLAGEASWLLPFVLGGLILAALLLWKRPIGETRLALILWAGWLLPEAFYFTYSQGLMHAYYLIMMGAPIAGLAGSTAWALWRVIQWQGWVGWSLAFLLAGGTLVFQGHLLWGNTSWAVISVAGAGLLFLGALGLAIASRIKPRLGFPALTFLMTALLVAPLAWSLLTTFNTSSNEQLPAAGPSQQGRMAPGFGGGGNTSLFMAGNGSQNPPQFAGDSDARAMAPGLGGGDNPALTSYLLKNTRPGTYLVATARAQDAAGFILSTGRPVLALGGFLGQYTEFTLQQFTALVENDRLRFVLGSALDQNRDISQWVQANCRLVKDAGLSGGSSNGWDGRSNTALYDCAN